MPAGRPRIHDPEKTRRVIITTSTASVNTLDILAAYLTAHTTTKANRQSLAVAAIDEYVRNHGTIVEQAVTWWRKGKKPPKEVVE